ncbi:MAG: hypothetical protein ABH837_03630 [bacterium]
MKLRSFTITELLIALAIFAVLASSIIYVIIDALEAGRASKDRSIASTLAQEGLEIIRNIRNRDYNQLTNGTYGLTLSENQWILSPTPELIQDRFTREIIIDDYATNKKLITSKISWELRPGRDLEINLESILSNWKDSTPTIPPWTNPYLASSLNLPGGANGLRVFVVDTTAYLIRTSSNQPEFYITDVNDPTTPNILGFLDLGANARDIIVEGNYAYISSDHDSQELQIIDVSDTANPVLTGTYNASGNANAYGVTFANNVVYLVRASSNRDELFSIDVSNPSSPTLIDSLNLNGTAKDIRLSENYAYIANSRNNQELQIININNPNNLSFAGTYNLPGNQDAYSVQIIDNNTILLGRANVNNGPELYTLDVTNKNNVSEIASFEAGQTINDLAYGSTDLFAFMATDNAVSEFQVVNNLISTPILYGSLDLLDRANGVFYSENNDIAYITSNRNNQELIIILPEQP